MLLSAGAGAIQPAPFPSSKLRLLLICDGEDRLRSFRTRLTEKEFEITPVSSVEGLAAACRGRHDVIAMDVGPAQIASMLKTIRTSVWHAALPVLVEATRLNNDPALAGVLPKYRAMPCCYPEMLTLLRRETGADLHDSAPRRML
jgi:hypothetical protein